MILQATRRTRPFPHLGARGGTAVEFALTLPIFLMFMLGLFEVARAVYLWNALSDVTRNAARAAAMVDAANSGALAALGDQAAMAARAGGMALGSSGLDGRILITHLNGKLERVDALPGCPSRNIINCNNEPNGNTCVRFVQARLCAPGSGPECARASYKLLFRNAYLDWKFDYPTFATVTPAGSLGRQSGVTEVCPAF